MRLNSQPLALSPSLRGGSWVVITGVISPLLRVISLVALIVTLLITAHEPPSKPHQREERYKYGLFLLYRNSLLAARHQNLKPGKVVKI